MTGNRAEPTTVDRVFGRRVRELRTAREWTQAELAERMTAAGVQMQQTTVAKIEGGRRRTTVLEVATLADLFEVNPSTFLDGHEMGGPGPASVDALVADIGRHQEGMLISLATLVGLLDRGQDERRLR